MLIYFTCINKTLITLYTITISSQKYIHWNPGLGVGWRSCIRMSVRAPTESLLVLLHVLLLEDLIIKDEIWHHQTFYPSLT